jgi:hypothetical protein
MKLKTLIVTKINLINPVYIVIVNSKIFEYFFLNHVYTNIF